MHRADPDISIIMPAFNAEKFIGEAIDSVIYQTFENWELIVVDDGSSDATCCLVQCYTEIDDRIFLVRQNPSGHPARARNRALAQARGRYVAFLDSDDIYAPTRLKECLGVFREFPGYCLVFNDFGRFVEDLQEADQYLCEKGFPRAYISELNELRQGVFAVGGHEMFAISLSRFSPVHTITVMLDRLHIPENELKFREDIVIGEDVDLWMRIIELGPVIFVNKTLSFYRKHDNSISNNRIKFLRDSIKIKMERYMLSKYNIPRSEKKKFHNSMARSFFHLAFNFEKQRNYRLARTFYIKSFLWSSGAKPVIALLKCNPVVLFATALFKRLPVKRW